MSTQSTTTYAPVVPQAGGLVIALRRRAARARLRLGVGRRRARVQRFGALRHLLREHLMYVFFKRYRYTQGWKNTKISIKIYLCVYIDGYIHICLDEYIPVYIYISTYLSLSLSLSL